MSNILISGCGISYSKQAKPTWVKVLQLCKLPIIDLGGPAVSNEYILNKLTFTIAENMIINPDPYNDELSLMISL